MYFAIRGATTVSKDDKQEIISATEELISQIIARNGLNGENCRYVSLIASTTADIRSYYPVRAVRESGLLGAAPLFSCIEPDIDGSLPLCIRVMLTADIPNSEREIKHVYLRNAAKLRPDISAQ